MGEKHTKPTFADIKAQVETNRLRWHELESVTAAKAALVNDAIREWESARADELAAHQAYRDMKALYRVAKQFNVTDLGQLKMLHKLQSGGTTE